MEKKDLKNLMIVELRNGNKYVVVEKLLIGINDYDMLMFHDENLTNPVDDKLDIVKVYDVCKRWGLGFKKTLENIDKYGKLLWERPKELLTLEEKEYLKAVIKPCKNKVKSVLRLRDHLVIDLVGLDGIVFPYFINFGFQFSGLEIDKNYTLKELGLED